MISTYKDKEDTRLDRLYKLLSKTDIQIIGNSLSTESTIQKEKEMKVRTKERGKLPTNN